MSRSRLLSWEREAGGSMVIREGAVPSATSQSRSSGLAKQEHRPGLGAKEKRKNCLGCPPPPSLKG